MTDATAISGTGSVDTYAIHSLFGDHAGSVPTTTEPRPRVPFTLQQVRGPWFFPERLIQGMTAGALK